LAGKGYFWPPGIGRNDTPDEWAEIFKRHGYELSNNSHHEQGFEKIAIYADDDGAQHVARQQQDGKWSSKLGDGSDIEHLNLEILEGELYGSVVRVLKRHRPDWSE
jgi:hypothetical protein